MKPTRLGISLLLTFVSLLGVTYGQTSDSMQPFIGSWEAPLVIHRDELRITLSIEMEQDELTAKLVSDGLGVYGLPADSVVVKGPHITTRFSRLDAEISGWLRFNESKDKVIRIDGDWFQGAEMVPIVLLPAESP